MVDKRTQVIEELYKPIRVNFPRRPYTIKSIDDVIQMDIAELQLLAKHNDGHRYFLCATNPFTKKIYALPLKTKTAKEVVSAALEILRSSKIKFKKIFTDRGAEFKNALFKRDVLEPLKIHHYFSYSKIKCAHVERAIGTIKRRLYKRMGMPLACSVI